MKKSIIIGVVLISLIVLVVIVILWCGNYSQKDDIAVFVGKGVTKTEYIILLNVQKDKLLTENNIYEVDKEKEFWSTEIDGTPTKEVLKDRTIEKVKEFKLQLVKSKEAGIKLTKEDKAEADLYMEQLKKNISGSEDRTEQEEQFVTRYGVSSKDYKNVYLDLTLIKKYIEQKYEKAKISENEMKKAYEENKKALDIYTIRQIIFATIDLETEEALTEAKKIQAGNKTVEIFNKLNNGGDAEKLALENSEMPDIKESKGKYQFKYTEKYASEIEKWAINAEVGECGIVQSYIGYHVVKLENISTYEDVREDVKAFIFEKQYNSMLKEWKEAETQEVIIKNQKAFDEINNII